MWHVQRRMVMDANAQSRSMGSPEDRTKHTRHPHTGMTHHCPVRSNIQRTCASIGRKIIKRDIGWVSIVPLATHVRTWAFHYTSCPKRLHIVTPWLRAYLPCWCPPKWFVHISYGYGKSWIHHRGRLTNFIIHNRNSHDLRRPL
jgi:hypothetical protein